MIVDEARKFTNADGGTLYIMSDDEKNFICHRSKQYFLKFGWEEQGKKSFGLREIKNIDGSPNYANVSAYVPFRVTGKYC